MNAPTQSLFIDDRAAAELYGVSWEVWRRIWKRLVDERGFPPPHIPPAARGDGDSNRRQWDAIAIKRWQDRLRPPELRDAEDHSSERARLDARLNRIERAE